MIGPLTLNYLLDTKPIQPFIPLFLILWSLINTQSYKCIWKIILISSTTHQKTYRYQQVQTYICTNDADFNLSTKQKLDPINKNRIQIILYTSGSKQKKTCCYLPTTAISESCLWRHLGCSKTLFWWLCCHWLWGIRYWSADWSKMLLLLLFQGAYKKENTHVTHAR